MGPMIYKVLLSRNAALEFARLSRDVQFVLEGKYFDQLSADPMGCGSEPTEDGGNDGYRKVVFGKLVLVYYIVDSAHVEVTLICEL